jgi:hypothetical protein
MAKGNRTTSMPRRATAAKAFRPVRRARPYGLLPLLDGSATGYLEMYAHSAIRAAWAAGENGRMQAARADLARWLLLPVDLVAMARFLADYNRRRCPQRSTAQNLDWLSIGSGCCERIGTEYDAFIAARYALEAALSILLEVPLEHPDDHAELLVLLMDTGWRHFPQRHSARVAKGMARYVGDCIAGREFVPTLGGARQ